ncbi:MAG TPA: hypothetical protein VMS22_16775 [Candidatus Eisenbacteria bacterium]|nr:hypothetical protein [Candidatus Eisenbacteria bacterium]
MVLATTTLFGWMFLPSFLHFPNGYDLEVKRDPPHYALGVDNNNIVSFDVPTGNLLRGGRLSLRFDGEDRVWGPGSDAVRIRFKWEF